MNWGGGTCILIIPTDKVLRFYPSTIPVISHSTLSLDDLQLLSIVITSPQTVQSIICSTPSGAYTQIQATIAIGKNVQQHRCFVRYSFMAK